MLTLICALALAPQASAAPEGAEVLKRMHDKLSQSTDLSLTLRQKQMGQTTVFRVKMKRPSMISVVTPEAEMHCDGKTAYMYVVSEKQYVKAPAGAFAPMLSSMFIGFDGVLGASPFYVAPGKAKNGFFVGKPSYVLTLKPTKAGGMIGFLGDKVTLYVDKSTDLPLGFTSESKGFNATQAYEDVVVGNSMADTEFAWTPPADAKQANDASAQAESDPALLKAGTVPPDFTLKTPSGDPLTLRSKLGKKATIVNFWFYG